MYLQHISLVIFFAKYIDSVRICGCSSILVNCKACCSAAVLAPADSTAAEELHVYSPHNTHNDIPCLTCFEVIGDKFERLLQLCSFCPLPARAGYALQLLRPSNSPQYNYEACGCHP
jgi:hypothetical protein